MRFCAQYGNPLSFYGNIQYGVYIPPFAAETTAFGAWPEEKPKQPGMLYSDWQDEDDEPIKEVIQPDYDQVIAERIGLIKQLKSQIEQENNLQTKNILREKLRLERREKEELFKLRALVDEEESVFMLLH